MKGEEEVCGWVCVCVCGGTHRTMSSKFAHTIEVFSHGEVNVVFRSTLKAAARPVTECQQPAMRDAGAAEQCVRWAAGRIRRIRRIRSRSQVPLALGRFGRTFSLQ